MVRTEERSGRPTSVILNQLEASVYDAVVLGSRGRGPLARALLGSVSHTLLQHARKPIAIARRASIRAILVGVDGSEPSLRAARLASELATRHGASLTLLLAAETNWNAPAEAREAERANIHAQATQLLQGMAPEIAATRMAVVGAAAETLLTEAQHLRCDLVLLGRSGRTPHPQVRLGSVAARVAFHTDASVLVVP